MRRALAGIVVLALGATAGSALGGVNGSWSGRFITPQEIGNIPTSAYPITKLVVGPAAITVQVSGKTLAAHDPETAMSTCVMRFRFSSALSSGGWRLYQQFVKPVLSGSVSGGAPEFSACGYDPSGESRVVLRVRPAGSKLKAEFGQYFFKFRQRPPEFGPGGLLGYLHH
jgi:hypothetical protein